VLRFADCATPGYFYVFLSQASFLQLLASDSPKIEVFRSVLKLLICWRQFSAEVSKFGAAWTKGRA